MSIIHEWYILSFAIFTCVQINLVQLFFVFHSSIDWLFINLNNKPLKFYEFCVIFLLTLFIVNNWEIYDKLS